MTIAYEYNGDGHRTAQAVDGLTTTFVVTVFDLPQVLAETMGSETTRYLYGYGLLAEEGSVWAWHLGDGLGSVRQLAGGGGQVTLAQGYTPFGLPLWSQGNAETAYGFTGEQWQADAGLLFLRARYYQPATGRFLTRDPFPGFVFAPTTQQPYVYVGNNPVLYVDPRGLARDPAGSALWSPYPPIGPYCSTGWKEGLQFVGIVYGAGAIGAIGDLLAADISAVVALACLDGDCANEAQAIERAGQKGLDTFSRAAEFGIRSCSDLRRALRGTGLHAHHLIEQRFAERLGLNPGRMPSIALRPEEHQMLTNAWRNAIGYSNSGQPVNTLTATLQDVWAAAQRIYADYPELLRAARLTLFGE